MPFALLILASRQNGLSKIRYDWSITKLVRNLASLKSLEGTDSVACF